MNHDNGFRLLMSQTNRRFVTSGTRLWAIEVQMRLGLVFSNFCKMWLKSIPVAMSHFIQTIAVDSRKTSKLLRFSLINTNYYSYTLSTLTNACYSRFQISVLHVYVRNHNIEYNHDNSQIFDTRAYAE